MPAKFASLDAHHPILAPALEAGLSMAAVETALSFYDQPHRHYHQRAHLLEMLDAAHTFGIILSAAQTLAILFHDAVYVPGAPRGSNEALSAQLMRVYAPAVKIATLDAAFSIITDTADHLPRSGEAEAVLDLDLMRLGASAEDFARHSRQIFDEQRPLIAVADEQQAWDFFNDKRVPFFQIILGRPFVYHGLLMRERFERSCRVNLSGAVVSARQRALRLGVTRPNH